MAGLSLVATSAPGRAEEAAKPANAPSGTTTAPMSDPRDQQIAELKRIVEELQKRVGELEKRPAPPGTPAPGTPPPAAPTPDTPAPTTPAPTSGSSGGGAAATYIPNLSVVGNLQFAAGDTGRTPGRGRFHFSEFEVALQDAVTPSLRYDVFLSAAKDDEWKLGMEEGYVTASRLADHLTARLGRIRVPFGKVNPTHPHTRLYIDQPLAMTAFLGPDGLISDGAVAEYLLPVKGFFARAELGRWSTTSSAEDGLGFTGGGNGAWSGRMWLGRDLGHDRELEFGASRYQGRGDVDSFGRTQLAVNGLDLTYRSFPGNYKRTIYQAELLAHETGSFSGNDRVRLGGYLMGAYRLNQFWEWGFRGDYTQFPVPINGREYAASLFLTKYITEQTSLRAQYTYSNLAGFNGVGMGGNGGDNRLLFQVLFGSGSHTHPLQ